MTLDREHTPGIHVSGEATLSRKPDVAYVSLYVRADGILLEDAVREAVTKVEEVQQVLRDAHGNEIRDMQVKDIHTGEAKPAMGLGMPRDRSNPPRAEVSKGILVVVPPDPALAVKIVDTACRRGCLMANLSGMPGSASADVILYGITESDEAELEAAALAIADAREKASRIAKGLEKRIGTIRHIGLMQFLAPDDFMRRNKTPLLARGSYLSVSPERVHIPARVSVGFELLD